MDEPAEYVCAICGRRCGGWGSDPWPLRTEGRCCDECSGNVIAARLLRLRREIDGMKAADMDGREEERDAGAGEWARDTSPRYTWTAS